MDPVNMLVGSGGCQIVVGTGATVNSGYVAYGCTVRVDGTQILSPSGFSGIPLIVGEYISFGNNITSIQLNSASDSVTLWIRPIVEYQGSFS
jgi:hypothetical protein